jgi:hypothetical protein
MFDQAHSEPTITPDLVKAQLRSLEQSTLFRHSNRVLRFLDYVVSKTIDGCEGELKERTIGVEAFGRAPQYDLNSDPIVRVTAGEVRKRLAQHYYDPSHRDELHIEIHPGSYVPEFRFHSGGAETQPPMAVELDPLGGEAASKEIVVPHAPSTPFAKRRSLLLTAGAIVVIVMTTGTTAFLRRSSPLEQFWQPIVAGPAPVVISVGSVVVLNPPSSLSAPSPSSVGLHALFTDPVALSDAIAIANLQQVLYRFTKPSGIQSSTTTSYSDLQKGPAILISGFNNPWTMRLTDSLRFRFVKRSVDVYEIEDRTDPTHKHWAINTRLPFKEIDHDYGVVARVHDPTTGQMILVAAGIGENGTIAASELLSDPRCFTDLKRQGLLPKPDQNWEAVIETKMIDGKLGPPHILDSYIW